MTLAGTISLVMSDLSEAQNERLRAAMEATIGKGKRFESRTALAKAIGIKQPSLTKLLNRLGGASHRTAELFAREIGKTVEEVIGPREPIVGGAASVPTLPDHIPAELRAMLERYPGRWSDEAIAAVSTRVFRGAARWTEAELHDALENANAALGLVWRAVKQVGTTEVAEDEDAGPPTRRGKKRR